VLVQTGRSQVVLPTRAVKGTAAHRTGTRVPHHHRPCLRPNYDEHQHWKVTDSPRVRAIELRTTMEAYPTNGGELAGGEQLVEFTVGGAPHRPGGGRAAS
jgi:hypothetical protein